MPVRLRKIETRQRLCFESRDSTTTYPACFVNRLCSSNSLNDDDDDDITPVQSARHSYLPVLATEQQM